MRPADGDPIVECLSLLKVYATPTGRVQAVRGIDLEIERGRVVAVVGPSGSGKSSLLRMIAAIDLPTAGDVVIDGVNLAKVGRHRRRVLRSHLLSHVYQRPIHNLLSHLTAREQVERVARRRAAGRGATESMLEAVGLADRADHLPGQLSGGEQQRLAFARGAVGDPALIIADEPTAELDGASAAHVLEVMSLLAERGITLVVATHDPRVLHRLDHVVTLRDGAIASVTEAGSELAVIDHSARLQIPVDVRARFADRRANVWWNDEADHLVVEPASRPGPDGLVGS